MAGGASRERRPRGRGLGVVEEPSGQAAPLCSCAALSPEAEPKSLGGVREGTGLGLVRRQERGHTSICEERAELCRCCVDVCEEPWRRRVPWQATQKRL